MFDCIDYTKGTRSANWRSAKSISSICGSSATETSISSGLVPCLTQRYSAKNDLFTSAFAYVAPVPFGVSLGGRAERTC